MELGGPVILGQPWINRYVTQCNVRQLKVIDDRKFIHFYFILYLSYVYTAVADIWCYIMCDMLTVIVYRATHNSVKRGVAIACRLSVCL